MDKICFYHDDLDGYCSAAIVYNHYNKDIKLQKINHGEVEFLKDVKYFDEIIFVDFTPPLEYVQLLAKNNIHILFLDHHETLLDIKDDIDKIDNVDMVLDLNHSGCMITWNYFNLKLNEPPLVVKLVEDMDIWKWEYNDTEDFVNGMDLQEIKNNPSSSAWRDLLFDGKDLIENITSLGSDITAYKKIYNSQLLESLSYEVIFNGHKILVCNAPKNNSKLFGDRIKDYDFVAIYSHKQDQYVVSLYSATGFNTTTISKTILDKYGHHGGGHAGASGFKCETLPWTLIKEGE
jgi:oligoribonuclease NrnB/cAMP/cGMP phosphodiesterase (DHH superfamily)